MTIAVALKVRDGVVLAADSASTLSNSTTATVARIYNHGNKIVNLRKGAPIGFMTWGTGGFGNSNIETLAKNFRAEWDDKFPTGYAVTDVASQMRDYLMNEAGNDPGSFGFVVAGHSPGQAIGEAWVVTLNAGTWSDPAEALAGEVGLSWWGEPNWIQRLVLGADLEAVAAFLVDDLGVDPADLPHRLDQLRQRSEVQVVHPAMPIQDAINLGGFLVDVTKGVKDFVFEAPTVGGPTEIAAITRHEGFKWVKRKHYYDSVLNPADGEAN